MTALSELRAGWDQAAQENAIGNIFTDREWSSEEFFRQGVEEIAAVMADLDETNFGRDRALDFGCGIGRLTVALADHFAAVDGVDISAEMVKRARPDDRVTYHVNDAPDLALFEDESFDFVYSHLVLQHMPSECQEGYVKDFIRVIRPDGVAVFQIPSEGFDHPKSFLSMHGTPYATVQKWVEDAGGELAEGYVAVKHR